jgi:hypothetical protein
MGEKKRENRKKLSKGQYHFSNIINQKKEKNSSLRTLEPGGIHLRKTDLTCSKKKK